MEAQPEDWRGVQRAQEQDSERLQPARRDRARRDELRFGSQTEKHEPRVSRNAASSTVFSRPSIALRCGNRPKRATVSWCRRAHSMPPEWAGSSRASCSYSCIEVRWCDKSSACSNGRYTKLRCTLVKARSAPAATRAQAPCSAIASPAKARRTAEHVARELYEHLRQRGQRVSVRGDPVVDAALERLFDQRAKPHCNLRAECHVLDEPDLATRQVARVVGAPNQKSGTSMARECIVGLLSRARQDIKPLLAQTPSRSLIVVVDGLFDGLDVKTGLKGPYFLASWRRGRDSNPRNLTVRLISSQVHSTTLPPLQVPICGPILSSQRSACSPPSFTF